MHRGSMDRIKKFQSEHALPHGRANRPREFVFVDKKTGVRRFEIKADKNGGMPMEQAVSLLAIHCVAHQQTPGDFGVMVAAGKNYLPESPREPLSSYNRARVRSCQVLP